MDKLAIVILNYNGEAMLRKFMPTLMEYSRDEAVVYVADNASTDGSVEYLKAEHPEVRLILLEKNWGFADGYNMAFREIEAEYFLLLNSDIEVTHHWLTPLIEFMDNHPEVAACQPKLLSESNKNAFEYAGASGGFIDKFGYPYCRGRIFDTVEDDNGQYDYPQSVFWATGAALLIRSRDYRAVGGLDGRFFAHNEEIDLCWRLHLAGRSVYCIPDSCVYHVGGGTLPKGNPMKTFLNFRNNLTMLYKNLPESDFRHVLRVRWFLDYLAAFEMLILQRSWGEFKAVFRARRAFGRWKRDFEDDRRRIQSSAVVHDIPERADFSILWKYYAKGKKKFSEL